jgi:hypothetical protein
VILVLQHRVPAETLKQLCEEYFKSFVKFVVDIQKEIIAVGGELHSDAEAELLRRGSAQRDLWGGNFFPFNPPEKRIEYTALINIRPREGNTTMEVQDPVVRKRMREVVERLLLSPDESLA